MIRGRGEEAKYRRSGSPGLDAIIKIRTGFFSKSSENDEA
jgi:hypothetical protein